MRLCVLDGHTLNPGDNPWNELAQLGELTVYDRTPAAEIVARARGAEIVLTNKTQLDGGVLGQLPAARMIAVLATGVNVVDVDAARRLGIVVCNVPEYGTASVAQHVFALLLELASQVGEHDAAVSAGEWIRSPDFSFWRRSPIELAGLTMGIVGYGRIGRRVAELARALEMKVVASGGRHPIVDEAVSAMSVDDLFRASDIISLHCPLTEENRNLVNPTRLASMKASAFLINTARGGLIDEAALATALRRGQIAGAGLDVLSSEPMRPDNPLIGAPNCIITPHVAWATLAARRRLMAATVDNVRAFLAGNPINVVT